MLSDNSLFKTSMEYAIIIEAAGAAEGRKHLSEKQEDKKYTVSQTIMISLQSDAFPW